MARPFTVIVSGVPRSGTSVVMQMLAAGGIETLTDGARPPDPDNPRGYHELEAVKRSRDDLAWLDRAEGKAVKVVHSLVSALPRDRAYRLIVMRRDLREVLRSQGAMLARRRVARDGSTEERLIEVYTAQLAEMERWARGHPKLSRLTIDYADLVADPASYAAVLDEFVGGGLDRAAMQRAVDASLYRQRAG